MYVHVYVNNNHIALSNRFLHLGTKHFEWSKCSKEQDAKVAPKKSIQKGTAKICISIFFVFSM